jgi:hypothetical protein
MFAPKHDVVDFPIAHKGIGEKAVDLAVRGSNY